MTGHTDDTNTMARKRRAVRGMLRRWGIDLARLDQLFGPYGEEHGNEYADGAEMQRNLETAMAHAQGFLSKATGG